MLEILAHWFAAVCGQEPAHTWAPGGLLLPCCQRCLGLYVGAGVATLLHLGLRPMLTGRFLELHGAFLLLMVPFGFHWVAQGPVLRTVTGVLFGFGVVTFLWLPLAQRLGKRADKCEVRSTKPQGRPKSEVGNQVVYLLSLGATLILLPAAARLGGASAVYLLAALACWGALGVGVLVVGNVGLGVRGAIRLLRRSARPGFQP